MIVKHESLRHLSVVFDERSRYNLSCSRALILNCVQKLPNLETFSTYFGGWDDAYGKNQLEWLSAIASHASIKVINIGLAYRPRIKSGADAYYNRAICRVQYPFDFSVVEDECDPYELKQVVHMKTCVDVLKKRGVQLEGCNIKIDPGLIGNVCDILNGVKNSRRLVFHMLACSKPHSSQLEFTYDGRNEFEEDLHYPQHSMQFSKSQVRKFVDFFSKCNATKEKLFPIVKVVKLICCLEDNLSGNDDRMIGSRYYSSDESQDDEDGDQFNIDALSSLIRFIRSNHLKLRSKEKLAIDRVEVESRGIGKYTTADPRSCDELRTKLFGICNGDPEKFYVRTNFDCAIFVSLL